MCGVVGIQEDIYSNLAWIPNHLSDSLSSSCMSNVGINVDTQPQFTSAMVITTISSRCFRLLHDWELGLEETSNQLKFHHAPDLCTYLSMKPISPHCFCIEHSML